jgi:hypothetical protein
MIDSGASDDDRSGASESGTGDQNVAREERAVSSIPLDTEDGGTVVIQQQNVGPDNQVGGGEFKDAKLHKRPEEADAEQQRLQARAPIDPHVPDPT